MPVVKPKVTVEDDGSLTYKFPDGVHAVITGPIQGEVVLDDGTRVNVSPPVVGVESNEHAAELARLRPSLAVGVHLVLTEHRPLIGASAAASLVRPDGAFEPWPWTYADYREPAMRAFLREAREFYKRRLHES